MKQLSSLSRVAVISRSSCALIMQGTTQKVGVSSSPTGASVVVDNLLLENTRLFAGLKRGEERVVRIKMPGIEKSRLTLTGKLSGWVRVFRRLHGSAR